jgi:(2Fe-2S) ferredoxin
MAIVFFMIASNPAFAWQDDILRQCQIEQQLVVKASVHRYANVSAQQVYQVLAKEMKESKLWDGKKSEEQLKNIVNYVYTGPVMSLYEIRGISSFGYIEGCYEAKKYIQSQELR